MVGTESGGEVVPGRGVPGSPPGSDHRAQWAQKGLWEAGPTQLGAGGCRPQLQ